MGAVVRDVLIALILAPVVGAGPATAIALVSRLVTALGDVIAAGTAFASCRRGKKSGLAAGSGPRENVPLPGDEARIANAGCPTANSR